MKEVLNVNTIWHRSLIELPEPGREVLGAEIEDKDNETGARFVLILSLFYFKAGTVVRVERDPDFKLEYPGKKPDTAEETLFKAIMGLDSDKQEIERDGWYLFDTNNPEGLLQYRSAREPSYWCYPVMPDGIEMNWPADECI